ncbi:TonB-dependent receptor [Sphingobium nicotianae]|uniref:TonB-dependent receptor n=1 Tax=Sphingobium nicotianae TaxID=2782607 RepID=A0A9X1D9T3_9SPHN|nr:TonB-dependent receptor [Sphingobium nicotianae]MBT2186034.1 TonB-dependent receptor [Sphingobium nicotianae]
MIDISRGCSTRRVGVRLLSTTLLSLWSLPAFAQASGPAAGAPDEQAATESAPGSDIVVTAQRRAQSVLSVPYNISAVDGDALRKTGALTISDLARAIPGVVTVDGGLAARGNKNNMTLRGLRTDAVEPGGGQGGAAMTASQVATYFGETQFTFPLMLTDIERVEVLRGPQGTLYGASSQAGTIRFVPNRPKFDSFSGYLNAGGSMTEHSSDPSFNVEGALNLPIASNFAARLIGGYIRAGGFIDAVNHVQIDGTDQFASPSTRSVPNDPRSGLVLKPVDYDSNRADQWLLRGELRYQPVENLDIQLGYLHQKTTARDMQVAQPDWAGGVYDVNAGAPGYRPASFPNGAYTTRAAGPYRSTSQDLRPYRNNVDLASLDITLDLGLASVTSATSYVETETRANGDALASFNTAGQNFLHYYSYFPRLRPTTKYTATSKTFTQEVRVVSSWDKPINYTIGAYYQQEDFAWIFRLNAPGYNQYLIDIGATPVGTDAINNINRTTRFLDRAVFGELTYNITPAWQVTGGVRFFWQKFDTTTTTELPPSAFAATASGTDVTNDRVVKINTSYDVTPTVKLYATYSEGFRRGGASGVPIAGVYASLPIFATFKPDIATNYEIGIKGSLLDRAIRFSADIFQIDLNNFQFQATSPSGNYVATNGKRAQSRGIEFDTSLRLSRQLDVTFAYNYTDAKVAETITIGDLAPAALFSPPPGPPLVMTTYLAGTPLPGVPKHAVSASFDYTIDLGGEKRIVLHGDGVYRTSAPSGLDSPTVKYTVQPAAFIGNLRVSYESSQGWALDAFVNNVSNDLAIGSGYVARRSPMPLSGVVVARPRSFGILARYKF